LLLLLLLLLLFVELKLMMRSNPPYILWSLCLVGSLSLSCSSDQASPKNGSASLLSAKTSQDCKSDCDIDSNDQREEDHLNPLVTKKRPHGPSHPGQSPFQGDAYLPYDLDGIRTIDGSNNNIYYPDLGAAGSLLVRQIPSAYEDGTDAPSGSDRPNPRAISNAVVDQEGKNIPNQKGTSDFIWQWGQFLDHDIDLTEGAEPTEPMPIDVPSGDQYFDPADTGTVQMPLSRSVYKTHNGVREQVNDITAFVDASNVYGSDEDRAKELRTMDGTGQLKVSTGNFLPFNVNNFSNAPSDSETFFLAGDIRANEQLGLTAMHTLFVREHNRLALLIKKKNPGYSGKQIYHLARALVGAEMQVITYNEFLPALLGDGYLRPYKGYKKNVDPSIANVFSTAAYRFGHSTLSPVIRRLDANGDSIAAGDLALKDAFFDPSKLADGGLAPIMRGLAAQVHQKVDVHVVDGLRNFLFGPPGAGGFDLASLNIQRGRDHGLPSYNEARIAYGLAPAVDFHDVTTDPVLADKLASVYGDVEKLDIWIGGLAEDHAYDSLLGPLFRTIVGDQFERLRDGDRFWYKRTLSKKWVKYVEGMSLAKIIRLNSDAGEELPDDVFFVSAP
jgi:hypothetical protein